MIQSINQPVSVVFVFDDHQSTMKPTGIRWNQRLYKITHWGYHHKTKQGNTLNHIFSVSTENLAFRLRLDTDSLIWYLEEISDGQAH